MSSLTKRNATSWARRDLLHGGRKWICDLEEEGFQGQRRCLKGLIPEAAIKLVITSHRVVIVNRWRYFKWFLKGGLRWRWREAESERVVELWLRMRWVLNLICGVVRPKSSALKQKSRHLLAYHGFLECWTHCHKELLYVYVCDGLTWQDAFLAYTKR